MQKKRLLISIIIFLSVTSLILGTLATATDSPPIQFRSFCILKYSIPYSETDPVGTGFTMKLLLPSSTSHQIAYGMSNSTVLCMSLLDQEEPDKIDFGSGGMYSEYTFKTRLYRNTILGHHPLYSLFVIYILGNSILGTGYSGDTGKPLLFTLTHGMVTLRYAFKSQLSLKYPNVSRKSKMTQTLVCLSSYPTSCTINLLIIVQLVNFRALTSSSHLAEQICR